VATLSCPKCGRETTDNAVFCPGCDFILDASFLGDDIMDVEADRRVKPAGKKKSEKRGETLHRQPTAKAALEVSDPFDAEALIVGELDDEEVQSFQASDTGMAQREVTLARVYVGGSLKDILMPEAIPEVAPALAMESVRLTPFERHLLELINGKRPVVRLREKSGLSPDDFQTALVLLADKGFIRQKGTAKKKRKAEPLSPLAEGATVVGEAPSALELDDIEAGASGFSGSKEATAPRPADASDGIHREQTLIVSAPLPDEGSPAEPKRRTSFADELLEEQESVFASPEDPTDTSRPERSGSREGSRLEPERAPRARRRPPLPGELPPGQGVGLEEGPLAAPPLDDRLPGEDARRPPRREDSAELAAEADPFAEQQTQVPARPLSVAPGDISLVEVAVEPPAAPRSFDAPPATVTERVTSRIEVSHFSREQAAGPALPPVPGAGPPRLPGASLAAAKGKSADAEPDSSSGEGVPASSVSFEMQRKADKIFEQAERDYAAGNVSSAVMNGKLALIYNPTEQRYLRFLAECKQVQQKQAPTKTSRESYLVAQSSAAEQEGDYARAAALLREALALSPKAASLHNRLGVLLATRLKLYKEAANHVLTAIDLSPSNLGYKNNLGKILGKEESALQKMPIDKRRHDVEQRRVKVKKMRPKLF
jgi:hypothetical protein